MKLSNVIIFPIISLFLYKNVFSHPAPEECPAASVIKSIGVSQFAVQESNSKWVTGRSNQKYNTNYNWTFIMDEIPAISAMDAYNKATAALNSLVFVSGPFKIILNKWICVYHNDAGYISNAIYPSIAELRYFE